MYSSFGCESTYPMLCAYLRLLLHKSFINLTLKSSFTSHIWYLKKIHKLTLITFMVTSNRAVQQTSFYNFCIMDNITAVWCMDKIIALYAFYLTINDPNVACSNEFVIKQRNNIGLLSFSFRWIHLGNWGPCERFYQSWMNFANPERFKWWSDQFKVLWECFWNIWIWFL
jgi:hypothetical protein